MNRGFAPITGALVQADVVHAREEAHTIPVNDKHDDSCGQPKVGEQYAKR